MKGTKNIIIHRTEANTSFEKQDIIVEESPLQIVVAFGAANNRKRETISVTMRTPGDDFNLVTGFLFCEGLIQSASDIVSIKYIGNPGDAALQENMMLVELAAHISFDLETKKRNFLSSAACGFCGKTNADIINQQVYAPISNSFKIDAQLLYRLPQILNTSQTLFTQTGGAHAVALISANAELIYIAEDVGRHNAMDKLVGTVLKKNALPLKDHLVLFSGRLSYELVQKSLAAGIPCACAIGAPSSLAIELAEENGMTLIGFLKEKSFNIYCGAEKIIQS
jgi:FdhD protein